jgi:hypothetical protein
MIAHSGTQPSRSSSPNDIQAEQGLDFPRPGATGKPYDGYWRQSNFTTALTANSWGAALGEFNNVVNYWMNRQQQDAIACLVEVVPPSIPSAAPGQPTARCGGGQGGGVSGGRHVIRAGIRRILVHIVVDGVQNCGDGAGWKSVTHNGHVRSVVTAR